MYSQCRCLCQQGSSLSELIRSDVEFGLIATEVIVSISTLKRLTVSAI